MKINVVYASDDNYAKHAGISIESLLNTNREIEKIKIYVIENNIEIENKQKIEDIVNKYKRDIVFIDSKNFDSKLKINDNFPRAAFSRLFLSSIKELEEEDKVLYLDCDTIVNDNIEELYNTNLEGCYFAAVQDNAAYYLLKKIGMNKKNRYINSGVLLINLTKWREDDIENKFLKFIEKHNGKVNHHDQGVLNGVCKDYIKILHPKFNMMPEMIYMTVKQSNFLYNVHNYYSQKEVDEAKKNPVIIHYVEKFYSRPWKIDCEHPMKNKYLEYLYKSEFNKELEQNGLNKKIQFRKKIYESTFKLPRKKIFMSKCNKNEK